MRFPDTLSKKIIDKSVTQKDRSKLRKRNAWERGIRRQRDL